MLSDGLPGAEYSEFPCGESAALGNSKKYKNSKASHNANARDGVTGGAPLIMGDFWFKPLLSASIIVLLCARACRARMHEVCTTMTVIIQVTRRPMGSNCDEFHPRTVMQQAHTRGRPGAGHG